MTVYLASPGNQLQADAARGRPVLLSFACVHRFKAIEEWAPSFDRLLLDSGAFSELNSGVSIDVHRYRDWACRFPWADNYAALDDISGDWRRSLRLLEIGGFPTFHDTDPDELLDDLLPIARQRKNWIGIGLKPPRTGREDWVRRTLDRIPDDIHVHHWAGGIHAHLARVDSFDSTHWWREAMKYRTWAPWLTYGECLEIAVKKMQRLARLPREVQQQQQELF